MTSPFAGLTRPWEIYLVHHTHTDLGYTDSQPLLYRLHAEYIVKALDYITATDHLADGERFCWTNEVSWTIKAFLKRYPERAEEFFQRVREGRIEVGGLFVQLTDLLTEETLGKALDYAVGLSKAHGFEVVTALNDDVNGWAWGLPKLMADRGLRYLDTATNEVCARGLRPRPDLFYWVSPGGEKVLLWHSPGYMQGNSLRFGEPEGMARMAEYLKELEDNGYPHNVLELRIDGESSDNAPPAHWLPDAIRAWNDHADFPRVRLTTPRHWFEQAEKNWPQPIKEYQAAWPDWWADGNGSAAYESALIRAVQADVKSAEALAAAGGKLDAERLDTVQDSAMFFGEHTWGSWCSTDDPDCLETRAQWNYKAGFAYTAAMESSVLVQEALLSCAPPCEGPEIVVFNPLPFPRTDLVETMVTDDLLDVKYDEWVSTPHRTDEGPEIHVEDVATGEKIAVSRRPAVATHVRLRAQWVRFIAKDIPAGGWKKFRLILGPAPVSVKTKRQGLSLENDFFRLTLDETSGGVKSLIHKASRREMINPEKYHLNQQIYERVESPESREALCTWNELRRDAPLSHRSPAVKLKPGADLPYGAALTVAGGGGELPGLEGEIVLYDELPRVDLFNSVIKPFDNHAEAIYHAFPFAAKAPTVHLDIPGAVLRPWLDQVPRTATDWHSIQHYFAVADKDFSIVVASPDACLVQVNDINTGKWLGETPPHNGTVMSWVLNNYWLCNFPPSQGGKINFRYSIAAWPEGFKAETAARFATTIRQPLLAFARKPGDTVVMQSAGASSIGRRINLGLWKPF